MKHLAFLATLCVASIGFAQEITPITSFETASYLGEGSWLDDGGQSGIYASYTTFQSSGWTAIHYRDQKLYFTENVLSIDGNGFFTAIITDKTNQAHPTTYAGRGNCGSTLCLLVVEIANGMLYKTMTFDVNANTLHIFGGIYFNDGTPNVSWQESLALTPGHAAFANALKPTTSFTPNNYAGNGAWLVDDGTAGIYKSFVNVQNSGWTIAKFSNDNFNIYDHKLFIDQYGFYTVELIDASDLLNPTSYFGVGSCGQSECQMAVQISNGMVVKYIKFDQAASTMFFFGATYFNDGTPSVQWEGSSLLVP